MLLGLVVGKGSTAVDDWFQQFKYSPARYLLFFTDARTLLAVLVACAAVAIYRRRWTLTAAMLVSPVVAYVLAGLAKRAFGRHKGDALCYPSGHATVMVVVFGMLVLLAGGALWATSVVVVVGVLGVLGQAVTYHYFTDAVGGVFLGTAIVCVASLISGRAPHRT